MWAFPWIEGAPNAAGVLVKHEMGKPSAIGALVYFSCDDCAVELARVENASGKFCAPKFSLGNRVSYRTEGNTIGFDPIE